MPFSHFGKIVDRPFSRGTLDMGNIFGNTHFSIKKCAWSCFWALVSILFLTQMILSKVYYLISYGKTNPYIKTKIWAKDTQYLLNIFFVTFNLPFWPYNSFWNGLDLVSSKFRPKSSVSLNYNKHMMPIKCQNLNSKTHIYFYQQLCFGCFLAFYSIFSVLARVFGGQHFWKGEVSCKEGESKYF